MKFTVPLQSAQFQQRYKRFFSDHILDVNQQLVTANCPNTGRMTGLLTEEARSWLEPVSSKTRKLQWDWHMVEAPDGKGRMGLVGINTGLPNKLIREAIENGTINELQGYDSIKSEQKYGEQNSRIDFLLSGNGKADCFVEVKNCHLRRQGRLAEFPDTVSARATKHMEELALMVERGHRAVVVFCVQRMDCDRFDVARDIDSAYGQAFDKARTRGVEILVYACSLSAQEIVVSHALPVL